MDGMGGMAMRQEDPILQKKRKEKSDKGDSHRTLTFTSWIGFGPMWAGQGPEVACQLQYPDLPSPEAPRLLWVLVASPHPRWWSSAAQTDHRFTSGYGARVCILFPFQECSGVSPRRLAVARGHLCLCCPHSKWRVLRQLGYTQPDWPSPACPDP